MRWLLGLLLVLAIVQLAALYVIHANVGIVNDNLYLLYQMIQPAEPGQDS